jgi:predicted esterase
VRRDLRGPAPRKGLAAVAANINGTAFFAFLAGTALGFSASYPSIDLAAQLTPAGQAVLDANNLGAMKPLVPLLQYHGLADEVIPWTVETALHSQYCAQGVNTELTGYPADHPLTQVLAQGQVLSWIGNRFTGSPAPSNC